MADITSKVEVKATKSIDSERTLEPSNALPAKRQSVENELKSKNAKDLAEKIELMCQDFQFTRQSSIPQIINTVHNPIKSFYDKISLLESIVFNKILIPEDWREQELINLRRSLIDCKAEVLNLLNQAYGRSQESTDIQEFDLIMQELDYTLSNFKYWIKENHDAPLLFKNASVYSIREPYGVVLIIGNWENPIASLIRPMISAIAAGNYSVLYPTTRISRLGEVLHTSLKKHMDHSKLTVIDKEMSVEELVKQKINFIYCSGELEYCKKLTQVAGDRYIPFSLNVSGKNIVIVDETADINAAVTNLLISKLNCTGQSSTAPDLIYVHRKFIHDFAIRLKVNIKKVLGDSAKNSKDLGRIIDSEQSNTLSSYLSEEHGGLWYTIKKINEEARYVEPVIITNPHEASKLRSSIVRGPILTLVEFSDLNEIYDFECESRQFLTNIYYFGKNTARKNTIVRQYKNSSIFFNEVSTQIYNTFLPKGSSGGFAYSKLGGEHGFRTLSVSRTVQEKGDLILTKHLLPPTSKDKYKLINKFKPLETIRVRQVKVATSGLIALASFAYYLSK